MSIYYCHKCDRMQDDDFTLAIEHGDDFICQDCFDEICETMGLPEDDRRPTERI